MSEKTLTNSSCILYIIKNENKKIQAVPTLPRISRPFTLNTHIFLFGLTSFNKYTASSKLPNLLF